MARSGQAYTSPVRTARWLWAGDSSSVQVQAWEGFADAGRSVLELLNPQARRTWLAVIIGK
jgi:hypothetical protein